MGLNVKDDEIVEIYQCGDGSWRISYWPFADKVRNLPSRDVAEDTWEKLKPEVTKLYSEYMERQQ